MVEIDSLLSAKTQNEPTRVWTNLQSNLPGKQVSIVR